MIEKIIDIISGYTDIPKNKITAETNLLTDLGLESMDFADIVCDFEDEFKRKVPDRDFRKLVTVKNIAAYIG